MTHKFKEGDLVTCKVHSHPMTVQWANDNFVGCEWFVGSVRYSAGYQTEDLTLSDEQPTPDLNLGGGE